MPEFATDAAAEVAAEEDSLINLATDENILSIFTHYYMTTTTEVRR